MKNVGFTRATLQYFASTQSSQEATLLNVDFFFCRLHDRKMFVLGLCSILGINSSLRPKGLHDCASQILPSLLSVFSGLQRSYESKFNFVNKTNLNKLQGSLERLLKTARQTCKNKNPTEQIWLQVTEVIQWEIIFVILPCYWLRAE